jgi:glutathione peroxidase
MRILYVMVMFSMLLMSCEENGGEVKSMEAEMVSGFYDFTVNDIDGNAVELSKYKGKVLLVVNVASKCGFTPQYEGLQKVYDKYKDKGFAVLGFPANNFGAQEPGTNDEIKQFCKLNYGVTFPVFSKISVKGADIDPLYKYLTSGDANPELKGAIKWNFNKFLVDKNGNVVARYDSGVEPGGEDITTDIESSL